MFELDNNLKYIKATPETITTMMNSINTPMVAVAGGAAEPSMAYVVTVREGKAYATYIFLHIVSKNIGLMYKWDEGPLPKESVSTAELEALRFTEEMGYMMDNMRFAKKSPEEKAKILENSPCFHEDLSKFGTKSVGIAHDSGEKDEIAEAVDEVLFVEEEDEGEEIAEAINAVGEETDDEVALALDEAIPEEAEPADAVAVVEEAVEAEPAEAVAVAEETIDVEVEEAPQAAVALEEGEDDSDIADAFEALSLDEGEPEAVGEEVALAPEVITEAEAVPEVAEAIPAEGVAAAIEAEPELSVEVPETIPETSIDDEAEMVMDEMFGENSEQEPKIEEAVAEAVEAEPAIAEPESQEAVAVLKEVEVAAPEPVIEAAAEPAPKTIIEAPKAAKPVMPSGSVDLEPLARFLASM